MNSYQRKTVLFIVAFNVVFGIQQFLINRAVVFPSPLNSFVFLSATVFFLFKTVYKSTRVEKLLLFLFLLTAVIQIVSDSLVLEVVLQGNHEQIYEWVNSPFYFALQIIGIVLLLSTIPILAISLRKIKFLYFSLLIFFFFSLLALAFLKIEFEPLIILGLLSCFFLFLTIKHQQEIRSGISAAMFLWVIFFLNEGFEYWNLTI